MAAAVHRGSGSSWHRNISKEPDRTRRLASCSEFETFGTNDDDDDHGSPQWRIMLHMFGHGSQRGWNAAGTRLLLLRRCGGLRPSILHRHVVRRPEDCTDAADICKAMGNLPRLLLTVPKSTVARYFIHIYFVCGGSLRPSRKYHDGYNESKDCSIKYKISAYMANLDYVGMECNMPSRS